MTQETPLPSNIKSLTSLRFVAAILIVFFHFDDKMGFDISVYTQFIHKAHLAVDFFFVLSGFIMAHVYLKSVEAERFSFSVYMGKRFARLYPLHLVTLILFVTLGGMFHVLGLQPNIPGKYDPAAIPVNLLMLQAWGLTAEGTFNTPSWSISAEWVAYMLFLPIAMISLRFSAYGAFALAVGFFTVYYFALPASSLIDKPITGLAHDFGILRIIPEFILGIGTYLLCRKWVLSEQMSRYLVIATALLYIILAHFGAYDFILIWIVCAAIFAFASKARYGKDGFLDRKIPVYLGNISYSMYMTHSLIYTVYFNGLDLLLGKDLPFAATLGIWFVSLLLVVPLAAIFHHAIEEPARIYLNKKFKKA